MSADSQVRLKMLLRLSSMCGHCVILKKILCILLNNYVRMHVVLWIGLIALKHQVSSDIPVVVECCLKCHNADQSEKKRNMG